KEKRLVSAAFRRHKSCCAARTKYISGRLKMRCCPIIGIPFKHTDFPVKPHTIYRFSLSSKIRSCILACTNAAFQTAFFPENIKNRLHPNKS
ncbi:MAG: hypothetical protein Q4D82_05760, partial [Neisseria sp.]|nr:hypothetical protein [Neisseria sp.]